MAIHAAIMAAQAPDRMTERIAHRRPLLAPLSGWGRYPVVNAEERRGEDLEAITAGDVCLTRGLGRSYGDSSLPPREGAAVAGSILADRVLSFDADSGAIRAEAGLSLARINRLFLPRGWFSPVTPGTQFVTLGGMVASDVHGKMHHVAGCFGEHVRALRLRVAGGRILDCSEDREPELFRATIGGMGLTGHILEVDFSLARVPSRWILQESERAADIDALVDGLKRSSAEWPNTMCWMDGLAGGKELGRGIVMRGRWAEPQEAPAKHPNPGTGIEVPLVMPDWFLRPWEVAAFNALYYRRHGARTRRGVVRPEAFYYPLDMFLEWNRLYGRRGFTQYQCVLPISGPDPSPRRFLELLRARGGTPYVCVVKDCGAEGKGMLSFPKPGISLAIDLPIRSREETQRLVDGLNEFVVDHGGRVYLTKDAFTRAEHYRAMDPRLDAWTAVRRKWDPDGRLRSAQSVRLFGDRA